MPKKIIKQKSGKYTLNVSDGYDSTGKQVVRTKTVQAENPTEAKKLYKKFEMQVQQGEMAYTMNYKLDEYARLWLKEYCEKNLSPKTVQSYRNEIDKRIIPALGAKRLRNVMPIDIINFINDLKTKQKAGRKKTADGLRQKLSPRTVSKTFRVLSSMLQDAVEWQLIEINPCLRVPRPKVPRKKMVLPEEKNMLKIIHAIRNEPYLKKKTLFYMAVATGCRRGELLGLKWSDIDMDSGQINVSRNIQEIDRKLIIKEPKTPGSVRSLIISGSVLDTLKAYHEEQMAEREKLLGIWADEDWVFTQWNGMVMNPSTPTHWWLKFLKEHDLPHLPFHGLRHVSATILIALGVPLKNVSARLGHTDIRTTANIYTDALKSVDRDAAEKMDKFFNTGTD